MLTSSSLSRRLALAALIPAASSRGRPRTQDSAGGRASRTGRTVTTSAI